MFNKKSMKIVAYELDCHLGWEPGIPPWNDPNYRQAIRQSYRTYLQEDVMYDVHIEKSAFPDYDDFNSRLSGLLGEIPTSVADLDLINTSKYSAPNPIEFLAFCDQLSYLDFPYNDQSWPIMSPGMLEILKKVGNFSHHTYATVIFDKAYRNTCVNGSGNKMCSFLLVQPTEFLDPYDWDKSKYRIDKKGTSFLGREKMEVNFTKLVLKEPLPPLFRLKGNETRLYISAAAKESLEANDTARGADFSPIDEDYEMSLDPLYPIPAAYIK
jgi:hypothetical protein